MKTTVYLGVLFLFLTPAFGQSANDLFQQALVMERSEGNLQEAISLYERVVATGSDRALAARALIRIGENYERQGMRQARQAYQRVLDDYSEQREVARIARDRLSIILAEMTASQSPTESGNLVTRHLMEIPDAMGKVSPDGRYLSFVEWDSGNVGFIDLNTGDQTLVNSDGSWADNEWAFGDVSIWSPDGKELMYLWLPRSGGEIRIYDTKTGDTRVVVPTGTKEIPFPVAWSNTGTQFLAINEREDHVTDAITLVNTKSADSRVVKTLSENWHTFGMDLSPDERFIVYESFPTGQRNMESAPVSLMTLSNDGSQENVLVENGLKNIAPMWDLDGSNVLFLRRVDQKTELWAQGVSEGQPTGQPQRIYSGFDGNVWPLGITNDGRYFFSQGMREEYVYEQGADFEKGVLHSNARVISSARFGKQRSGSVSPNGEYLAFASGEPGSSSLVVTQLSSGSIRLLELTSGQIQRPERRPIAWSPDGENLLVGVVHEQEPALISVHVSSGSEKLVTGFGTYDAEHPNAFAGFAYSHDGKKIIFAANKHLVEISIADNSRRVVHKYEDRHIVGMSLSPDGRRAAVTVRAAASGEPDHSTLEIISMVDGTATKMDDAKTAMGYSANVGVSWSPDGDYLVFAENRPNSGQQLFSLNLATGKRTVLGEPVFGSDQFWAVSVHPSGDKLTFWKRSDDRLQLWVLEGIDL